MRTNEPKATSGDVKPAPARRWLISRHAGAHDWCRSQGVTYDIASPCLTSLKDGPVRGDVVIGTLPLHLAAELSARGVRVVSIVIDVPPSLRGKEFDSEQMQRYGAHLAEYRVLRVQESYG